MSLSDERVQYEDRLADIFAGLGISSTGDISTPRMSAVNYVKAKLNELVPEGEGVTFSLSSDTNITNPTDWLVNSQMDESVKNVCLQAPLSALKPTAYTEATEGTPFVAEGKAGYIALPDTFLRLSSFKMSDWVREIVVPITPNDPLYKRQSNEYMRGGITKPVAVLNWKYISSSMKRILEYYSIDTLHTIEKLFYIPEQLTEDFVTDNPSLEDAFAWQCASKVLQIFDKAEPAKLAQERVQQIYNTI